MSIEVAEESIASLAEYATIPIAFDVRELFDPKDLTTRPEHCIMNVRSPTVPFTKNYDAIPENSPLDWPRRFDLSRWAFFAARAEGTRVGGAVLVYETPTVAVLWDIRVAPTLRHSGVGSALLATAEASARRRGVRWLRVETQSINLAAYRFYLKHGFTLTDVNPGVYRDLPEEVQLLLHKKLPGSHTIPDTITTPRLVLRRWRKSEARQLKTAIDENLAHLQAWMPWAMAEPVPLDVMEDRVAKFESQFDSGLEWLFAIRSRANDEVLGGAGLHPRIGPDGLEIGYWLRADATGNGFATEAAEALTRVTLQQAGAQRVQIRCDPRNNASAGVPRRLGYKHILTIENESFAPSGSLRDTLVWEFRRV